MYYHIALTLVPGIGPVLARNLISYCGNAEAVFKTKRSQLLKVPGIGEAAAASIVKHDVYARVDEELTFMEKHEVRCLTYTDPDFPKRLKHCQDAPLVLFTKGPANLNMAKILGVVGTRNATGYGKMLCDQMISALAAEQVLIISGLAYGIDIAAHRSCLKYQVPTVGVMAHGLDRIYPYAHRETARNMLEQGGLVTEFMSNTTPDRQNFPKRNRIVAGMVDGLVVVETGVNGGAVITALLADDYHRDVMAFPAQVNAHSASGCNKLIKTNKAAMVENAQDILHVMGWQTHSKQDLQVQQTLFPELDDDEQLVYELLRTEGEVYIDDIQQRTQLTPGTLAGVLLSMEFKGIMIALAGKRYRLQ